MRLLGIRRGAKYSPNLVDSDAAIFNKVTEKLIEMGHKVDVVNEDEMCNAAYDTYDRVYGMERDCCNISKMIDNLSDDDMIKFANSLEGIMTCTSKGTICVMMQDAHVPQPDYKYYKDGKMECSMCNDMTQPDTASGPMCGCHNALAYPVWMKNSDSCAVTSDDTTYCTSDAERHAAINNFEDRGIRAWVEQKHMQGDLIKFYGVEGTDFFHWQYASHGHSKFGLEKINGKEVGYRFDALAIKESIDRLASRINVPIYGGDAIIDADGHFWIIDFNDFPSFSSCREKAAEAIARRIVR